MPLAVVMQEKRNFAASSISTWADESILQTFLRFFLPKDNFSFKILRRFGNYPYL